MIQSAEISCEMFVSEGKGKIYFIENQIHSNMKHISMISGVNTVTQQTEWIQGWEEQSYRTRWSFVTISKTGDVVGVIANLSIVHQMLRQSLRNLGICLLRCETKS